MAARQFFRDVRGCFADSAQFLDNRATQHLRILKRLEIDSSYELGNVIGSLDDVIEVQVVTPHKRVGRLQAPKTGCEA